ncbi:hypothetical protein NGB36_18355 [Streptomyces sp. RB6PN25]|uniref:Uncharacterized protein n=1 Tax=Streptomyces humicola TaxID=2953240 RepID=A0ABT1PZM0_9ACTN|nr:hypothetical protein [Streptomyces humicola]MCQ4082510.1 hypothetical protein [Streptomyces humicola]
MGRVRRHPALPRPRRRLRELEAAAENASGRDALRPILTGIREITGAAQREVVTLR